MGTPNCALEDFSSWKDRVQEEVCPTPHFTSLCLLVTSRVINNLSVSDFKNAEFL